MDPVTPPRFEPVPVRGPHPHPEAIGGYREDPSRSISRSAIRPVRSSEIVEPAGSIEELTGVVRELAQTVAELSAKIDRLLVEGAPAGRRDIPVPEGGSRQVSTPEPVYIPSVLFPEEAPSVSLTEGVVSDRGELDLAREALRAARRAW